MSLKNIILIAVFIITSAITVKAQEKSKHGDNYKIITGVRVNPLLIYDLEGGVKEKVLLHGELKTLLYFGRLYSSYECCL